MKKILSFIIAAAFVVVFSFSVLAADVPRIVDNAGIIGEENSEIIRAYLDEKSDEHDFDFAVLAEESIGGGDIVAYADDYFDNNGFGRGEDGRDGILLVIVMDTREWAFSTSGFGVTVFGDYELGEIEDAMVGELSNGNYAQAVYNYAQVAEYYVRYAKENGFDFSEDGYYTYDDPSYYDDYEPEPMPATTKLGICGIFGSLSGLISVLTMKGKMNTVHKKQSAGDYVRRGSLNVYRSNDYFINKTVAKTMRYVEKSSSGGGTTHHGGGSTHISSSGHSHGGSHGHF